MVDFVEDLGLAGIRFVYFSDAGERESKGRRLKLFSKLNFVSLSICGKARVGNRLECLYHLIVSLDQKESRLPRTP